MTSADEATLVTADGSPRREENAAGKLSRGMAIGRYVVLSEIGAGGMGIVYAAYDPELDRKVALKLLLPDHSDIGHVRLVREARALAKLQHPNVVAIHDVGTHANRVWLAMEFVEGESLDRWRARKTRGWSEVLEVLVAAGRGVAAAHAAGVLHRDLKPPNIMVGHDGRVRVMDFGLARSAATEMDAPCSDAQTDLKQDTSTLEITRAGAIVGTPSYMSPEQLANETLGPATDQFSFCVTLWEALYGARPFHGTSIVELATAVLQGEIGAPPRDTKVPTWLRRVIERGLARNPTARWPSMDALFDELGRARGHARTRRGLTIAGAIALLVAGGYGWSQFIEHRRIVSCKAEGATITEVWNDDTRAKLRNAMLATELSYAQETVERLLPRIDRQAENWRSVREEVCLEANVGNAWDAEMLDRSLWCLEDQRTDLGALVNAVARPRDEIVQRAISAVEELQSVERCREIAWLEHLSVPPRHLRADIQAIRAALPFSTMTQAADFENVLMHMRGLLARADALRWSPLVAAAQLRYAQLLELAGHYEEAERAATDAYFKAADVREWGVAARSATVLIHLVGYVQARPAQGLEWGRHADLALLQAGKTDDAIDMAKLVHLAHVHFKLGDHDRAHELMEQALALQEHLPPGHPSHVAALTALGNVLAAKQRFEEARDVYERALVLREEAFGPRHPHVANSLNNLATVHFQTGAYHEARRLFERALSIREETLEPTHPLIANSLANLAAVYRATGSDDDTQPLLERALAIREQALGREHPDLAATVSALADVELRLGEHERAAALYARALAIREKAFDAEHPDVTTSTSNLALSLLRAGNVEDARRHAQRALETYTSLAHSGTSIHAVGPTALATALQELGEHEQARALLDDVLPTIEEGTDDDHPDLARLLVRQAMVLLATGAHERSLDVLERAVSIYDRSEIVDDWEIEARFLLARALVEQRGSAAIPRALRVAKQALVVDRPLSADRVTKMAEIDAWITRYENKR